MKILAFRFRRQASTARRRGRAHVHASASKSNTKCRDVSTGIILFIYQRSLLHMQVFIFS
jgi:hypothetical protein